MSDPKLSVEALKPAERIVTLALHEGVWLDDNNPWRMLDDRNLVVFQAVDPEHGAYGDSEPEVLAAVRNYLNAAPALISLARDGLRLQEVEAERDRQNDTLEHAGKVFLDTNAARLRAEAERNALAERVRVLEGALRQLLVAVEFNAPPRDFGEPSDPNPCWEARIPVGFTDVARAALTPSAAQSTGADR